MAGKHSGFFMSHTQTLQDIQLDDEKTQKRNRNNTYNNIQNR